MRKRRKEPEGSETAGRITPLDIQQKEFRLAFHGYNERDVDVFLDQVTEEFARLHSENRRIREQLDLRGPSAGGPLGSGEEDAVVRRAQDEADAIIRVAQAEAGRIVADAERRSAMATSEAEGTGSGSGSPQRSGAGTDYIPASSFVARERTFLQNLAGLIQRHAEEVKEELRKAREGGATAPATGGRPSVVEVDASAVAATDAGPTDDETPPVPGAEGPPTRLWSMPVRASQDAPGEPEAEPEQEAEAEGGPADDTEMVTAPEAETDAPGPVESGGEEEEPLVSEPQEGIAAEPSSGEAEAEAEDLEPEAEDLEPEAEDVVQDEVPAPDQLSGSGTPQAAHTAQVMTRDPHVPPNARWWPSSVGRSRDSAEASEVLEAAPLAPPANEEVAVDAGRSDALARAWGSRLSPDLATGIEREEPESSDPRSLRELFWGEG
jgi:DivIVA domain-containing protein